MTSELVRLVFHEVAASPGFAGWLGEQGVSVALTNGNRLFLVGVAPDGSLSVVERQYGTCTALAVSGPDTLYLATRYQIWRLENALPAGEVTVEGQDRLYIPQTAWTTGLLGVHHMVIDGGGRLVFVNGRFSCLATVDDRLNFRALWVPPFISALQPEDRCGLTGVALLDGEPAYVASASQADTKEGWREHRRRGGLVMALSGDVVATGLSMPSSPVVHEDRLWLANGGTGELSIVNLASGGFETVAQVPGVARGLAMHGEFAAVGSSRPRPGETFDGLAVDDRLARTGATARCGVFVVGLDTGRVEHWMTLEGVAPDIADVAVIPGVRAPSAVGFQGDDVQELVTAPCLREDAAVRSD